MSRRLLAALSVLLAVLALSFVFLQWMLLDPVSREPSLLNLGESHGASRVLGTAESFSDGWRRVRRELGRRAPEIEPRTDR